MAPGLLPRVLTHSRRERGDLLGPWGGDFVILWPLESQGGASGGIWGLKTINQLMSTAQVTMGFHLPYYMANQLFQPRNNTGYHRKQFL